MKISYLSDLHLEFGLIPDFEKTEGGDVLIMAGDIFVAAPLNPRRTDKAAFQMRSYMQKMNRTLFNKFDKVLYIMGNHEHYGSIYKHTYNTINSALIELGIQNVRLLEDETVLYKGIYFIGSTLWSDFQKENPISMNACGEYMNDFNMIGSMDVDDMTYFNRNKSRTLTPNDVLGIHKYSLNYIKNETHSYASNKCVVITHHAPTYKSLNTIHSGGVLDGAYASDLSDIMLDNPNITHWIHGHCHMNTNYMVGNCNVLSCQCGYRHENSFKNFTGPLTFEIGE